MEQYTLNVESIVAGPTILADRLSEMDKLSDEELYSILRGSYSVFLSNAINSPCLDFLRHNSRFITILSQVIMEVELKLDERIYCNSMIYKELSETESPYLQRVYYILGMLANQNIMSKIMSTGIDKALATYLAVVRKSSFNFKDNVSRLNFAIMCATPEKMTVQRITDIYCALFNTVTEVKDLFFLIIRDTYVFSSEEDWITPDILQVARNMNCAVLSILDSLSRDKLYEILSEYAHMILIEDLTEEDVRFSFKIVSPIEFPKIVSVMTELADKELPLI